MQRRTFLSLTGAAGGLIRFRYAAAALRHRPKVVIVGGGFAGASCALHLRRVKPAIDVTLVDPASRYVTCPMSNSVLVGLRDFDSIVVQRPGLRRAGIRVVRDRAVTVDARQRLVRLAGGSALSYDRLIMAPGIRFLWQRIQGYTEAAAQLMPHAWVAGSQTKILAARLQQVRDGGVVAISVPAGPMRCPPGPFERASLIAGFLQQRKRRCKVLIFDANNRFPKQDVYYAAWAKLYPGMIEWISVLEDGAVVRVDPAAMTLFTSHGAHRVDVANVIPPQAPAALAVEAGLASARGWCPVKPDTFESTLMPDVHVIGDACIADPMPKAASAANAQAKVCALAVAASFDGGEPPAASLESVCYSLLGAGRAISIHGKFAMVDGVLRQLPVPDAELSPSEEAASAEAWYEGIVADSFGR